MRKLEWADWANCGLLSLAAMFCVFGYNHVSAALFMLSSSYSFLAAVRDKSMVGGTTAVIFWAFNFFNLLRK